MSADYDLLLFTANWPLPRINAWDILLQARAVENQAYCVGLNRVGKDGNDKEYNGRSCIVGPKGNYITGPHQNEEAIIQAELNWKEMQGFRNKFPQGLDADRFNLSN